MSCNRVRLTADGKLRNCLFSLEETDVRSLLRGGAGDDERSSVPSVNPSPPSGRGTRSTPPDSFSPSG